MIARLSWMVIDGIAQLVAAIAAIVLAAITYSLVRGTKSLAVASVREAEATEKLAGEAKTDRQLTWLPKLELKEFLHVKEGWSVVIRNSGVGPAFNVVIATRHINNVNHWGIATVGDLVPGEEAQVEIFPWREQGALYSIFDGYPSGDKTSTIDIAILCLDGLSRKFRHGFSLHRGDTPDRGFTSLQPEIFSLESNAAQVPNWTFEPLIWG